MIDLGEDLGGEVQAGGGGGDGSFFAGEGGLVAVAVGDVAFAVHVVGEGEPTVRLFIHPTVPPDDAVSIFQDGFDGADSLADLNGAAGFHFFPRTDEALPLQLAEFVGADEFDAVIVGEESSRCDLGVIEDE